MEIPFRTFRNNVSRLKCPFGTLRNTVSHLKCPFGTLRSIVSHLKCPFGTLRNTVSHLKCPFGTFRSVISLFFVCRYEFLCYIFCIKYWINFAFAFFARQIRNANLQMFFASGYLHHYLKTKRQTSAISCYPKFQLHTCGFVYAAIVHIYGLVYIFFTFCIKGLLFQL